MSGDLALGEARKSQEFKAKLCPELFHAHREQGPGMGGTSLVKGLFLPAAEPNVNYWQNPAWKSIIKSK